MNIYFSLLNKENMILTLMLYENLIKQQVEIQHTEKLHKHKHIQKHHAPNNQNATATNNIALLVIEKETQEKRPLSYTATGVAAQYELTLDVRYHYEDTQYEIIVPSQNLTSRRVYNFDTALISATQQEEKTRLAEMRQELALRILNSARAQ